MKYGKGKNPNSRNGFKKGHIKSLETRIKISEGNKGKIGYWRGKKRPPNTPEQKRKISETLKRMGHKPPSWEGKHHSEETRKKMSERMKGVNNNFWKGGLTSVNLQIKNSREYKLWRKAVYERDNYTCLWCGKRGGKLNADHIKPFCDYPELRFAIDNGRTLCHECHKKTDTYGINSRYKLYERAVVSGVMGQ